MQSNTLFYNWLLRRGITPSIIEQFELSVYNHPQIGECLKIPYSNTHSKYRRDPNDERKPKYLYDTGGKVTLYGLDKINTHLKSRTTPIVITEGEIDTLVLRSLNILAVSSTGGAMSWQEEWSEQLQKLSDNIYICFDNDETGARGAVKVLKTLPNAKIILIPEIADVKDISDYVARGGDFHKLMASALTNDDTLIKEDKSRREGMILTTRFHQEYLNQKQQDLHRDSYQPSKYEGDDRILRAKSYPMTELIDFRRRKACCLWHNEKTPSLHYYPKTNSAYCFGQCGRVYDSIDAYQMKYPSKTFKEAVDDLNKMV